MDDISTPGPDPKKDIPAATQEPEDTGRRKGPLVAAILVILALAGVIGVLGYDALSTRLAARADLDRALELVKEADETVLLVDDVVRGEITAELAPSAREASEQVPAARRTIQEALDLLESVQSDLDDDDRAIAAALVEAGAGRLAMLDEAPEILRANEQSALALAPASKGLEAILAAQSLANDAAEKFNLQTEDGVEASTELTDEALDELRIALAAFADAAGVFPEADMGLFVEYAQAKRDLLEESLEIDKRWLAGDLVEANKLVDAYNDKDEEVSKLAEGLPESETAPIAAAYDEVTAGPLERYMAARNSAARADTRLRQLLGEDPPTGETGETTGTASDVTTDGASVPGTETTGE